MNIEKFEKKMGIHDFYPKICKTRGIVLDSMCIQCCCFFLLLNKGDKNNFQIEKKNKYLN